MSRQDVKRMEADLSGGELAIRTRFSETEDLVQIFRGLRGGAPNQNNPVDFRMAGLQHRGCLDIWHIDRLLSFSTDECAPFAINDEDIGGNHGHPCAVLADAHGHGKSLEDVGSLWRDEQGIYWTILNVISPDKLLLISENIGASKERYAFRHGICGKLSYVENGAHTQDIFFLHQQGRVQLTPSIRPVRREALGCLNGAWHGIGSMESMEQVKIFDAYEVINPATVAPAIRKGRPQGGYLLQPSLACGEAMLLHDMVYTIEPDGTVLCSFDHRLLQSVPLAEYLGLMYQQKSDAFGGGTWRVIPAVRPFEENGQRFDFSRPVCTSSGAFPQHHRLTKEDWFFPACPPDRQLEYYHDAEGKTRLCFAAGFLPVGDGVPERRAGQISEAGTIVSSRKAYPTFAGGHDYFLSFNKENGMPFGGAKRLFGTAYKKYFAPPREGVSAYTVAREGKTYLFIDFFADMDISYTYPFSDAGSAELLGSSGIRNIFKGNGSLSVSAQNGFAVFLL